MSTRFLLFASAFLLLPGMSTATVLRANYFGYGAAHVGANALVSAVAAAAAGDTIHIEAATGVYNTAIVDLPLVIIGPGYFLNENTALQASPLAATLAGIQFTGGAAGSRLMGVVVNGGVSLGADNVTVERCRIGLVFFPNWAAGGDPPLFNQAVVQCYITAGQGVGTIAGNPSAVNNLLISNCYFAGTLTLLAQFQGTISHCVINNGASVHGVEFHNNIVRGGTTVQNSNTGITMHHNIFHDDPGAWLTGGSNHVLQDMALIFGTGPTTDLALQPLGTCANCAAGYNGQQIGMFGGATPYRASGIPAIPAIYELNAPATAVQGEVINVTLSTRSND